MSHPSSPHGYRNDAAQPADAWAMNIRRVQGYAQHPRATAPTAVGPTSSAPPQSADDYTLTHGRPPGPPRAGRLLDRGRHASSSWPAGRSLTGTYFAFHDDVLKRLIGRQAEMQFAYEDRIAELRAQVDRIASRQLLDQEQFEQKLEQLVRRQATAGAARRDAVGISRPDHRPARSKRGRGADTTDSGAAAQALADQRHHHLRAAAATARRGWNRAPCRRRQPARRGQDQRAASRARWRACRIRSTKLEAKQAARAQRDGRELRLARRAASAACWPTSASRRRQGAAASSAAGAVGGPFVPLPISRSEAKCLRATALSHSISRAPVRQADAHAFGPCPCASR